VTEQGETRAEHVRVKARGLPLAVVAVLIGFIAIFTKWGIAAAIGFWVALMIALLIWTLGQFRRARREIRHAIEQAGSTPIEMRYRHLRLGLFSLWDTSRSQHVYRVVVREATGRERIVWARWGRRWYWNQDTLELKWEEWSAGR
jgi:hypothetical protein